MAKSILALISFLFISTAFADEAKIEPTVIASATQESAPDSLPALPSMGDEPKAQARDEMSPAMRAVVFIGAAAAAYFVIKDANESGNISSVQGP